jgi:hypothetical protein
MATLKIKATADVSNAKAGIKEITTAEAQLAAQQAAANAKSRMDSARTAQERVRQAKAAGNVSKIEMGELRRLERIAVADAKAAAREVAQAKREASRLATAEAKAAMAAEKLDRDNLIRGMQERAVEGRKLIGGGPKKAPGQAGLEVDRQYLGEKLGKFAGPAGIAMGGMALLAVMQQMLEELRAIRTTMAEQAIKTGERSLGLAGKMRDKGFSEAGIADVVKKVQYRGGALSSDELSDIAEKGITDGYTDAGALNKFIETEAQSREQGSSPAEQAALRDRQVKRQVEIRNTIAGQDHARTKNAEDVAKFNREAYLDENDGGRLMTRVATSFDVWMGEMGFSNDADELKKAGGKEQFYNQRYNEYQKRYGGGSTITVRLDPESIKNMGGGRSLGGD